MIEEGLRELGIEVVGKVQSFPSPKLCEACATERGRRLAEGLKSSGSVYFTTRDDE